MKHAAGILIAALKRGACRLKMQLHSLARRQLSGLGCDTSYEEDSLPIELNLNHRHKPRQISYRGRFVWFQAFLIFCFLACGVAYAQPSIYFTSGQLISPEQANSAIGASSINASPAAGEIANPRVQQLARSLQGNPQRINDYIRDHIALTSGFGLQRGAAGVILDGEGTAFDVAQLFVQLVRAEGGQARYVYGSVTLDPEAARDVFRINHWVSLDDYFAAADLPAVVSSSSVRFSHVWVEASVPGLGWRTFDPALKRHVWSEPQLSLYGTQRSSAQSMYSQALASAQTGQDRGFDWISGISQSPIEGSLTSLALQVENQISSNSDFANASYYELFGGYTLSNDAIIESAMSSHPDVTVVTRWSGDIPNALRHVVQISSGGHSVSVYADQYYDTRITLSWKALNGNVMGSNGPPGDIPADRFEVYVFGGHASLHQIDTYIYRQDRLQDFIIDSFELQYPNEFEISLTGPADAWLGEGGVLYSGTPQNISDLVVSFSGSTTRTVATYQAGMESSSNRRDYDNTAQYDEVDCSGADCPPSGTFDEPDPAQYYFLNPGYYPGQIGFDRDLYWREWSAALTSATHMMGAYYRGQVVNRASLGLASGRAAIRTPGPHGSESPSGSVMFDVVTDHRIIQSGQGASTNEFRSALSAMNSVLESSIGAAASARASNVLRNPEINLLPGGAERISHYRAAAGSTTRHYLLRTGTVNAASDFEILGFTPEAGQALFEYASDGFELALTEASTLPASPRTYGLYIQREHSSSPSNAYLMVNDALGDTYKGAGVPEPGEIVPPSVNTPSYDNLIAQHPGLSQYGVEMRTGGLSYSPSPDLFVGSGGFPYALTLQRTYNSSGGSASLGGGWTHNWDISASITYGATEAISPQDPLASAGFIAWLELASGVAHSNNSLEAGIVQALLATSWAENYSINNAVSIQAGDNSTLFRRTPSGLYRAGRHSLATLREAPLPTGVESEHFLLSYQLVYESDNGEVIYFIPIEKKDFDSDTDWSPLQFFASRWVFPYGVELNFDYRGGTGTLLRVYNNLGWYLQFYSEDRVCGDVGNWLPGVPQYQIESECAVIGRLFRRINRVEAGYVLDLQSSLSSSGSLAAYIPSNVAIQSVDYLYDDEYSDEYRIRNVNSSLHEGVYSYGYEEVGTFQNRGQELLSEVYSPRSASQPDIRFNFSTAPGYVPARVTSLSLLQEQGYVDRHYYITGDSGVFVNANGEAVETVYRPEGWLWWTRDPEGRFTINDYSGAGLVSRTRQYQGELELSHTDWADGEHLSWVEYEYDRLGNRTRQTVLPRYGALSDALVTEYRYEDANWPRLQTHVIDPRGGVSRTYYYPTTGLVRRETGPSGEDVSYQYSPIGLMTRIETVVEQ